MVVRKLTHKYHSQLRVFQQVPIHPVEEKDDVVKDAFYAKLEDVYDKCLAYDNKIVLGDFNANVGRKCIFGPTVG